MITGTSVPIPFPGVRTELDRSVRSRGPGIRVSVKSRADKRIHGIDGGLCAWLQAVNKVLSLYTSKKKEFELISWCIFCLLYYTIGKGKLPIEICVFTR